MSGLTLVAYCFLALDPWGLQNPKNIFGITEHSVSAEARQLSPDRTEEEKPGLGSCCPTVREEELGGGGRCQWVLSRAFISKGLAFPSPHREQAPGEFLPQTYPKFLLSGQPRKASLDVVVIQQLSRRPC